MEILTVPLFDQFMLRAIPDFGSKRKKRMTTFGQTERATQNRVIALFRDERGYRYPGDKTDLANNSNIEEVLLLQLPFRGHRTAGPSRSISTRRRASGISWKPFFFRPMSGKPICFCCYFWTQRPFASWIHHPGLAASLLVSA